MNWQPTPVYEICPKKIECWFFSQTRIISVFYILDGIFTINFKLIQIDVKEVEILPLLLFRLLNMDCTALKALWRVLFPSSCGVVSPQPPAKYDFRKDETVSVTCRYERSKTSTLKAWTTRTREINTLSWACQNVCGKT